MVRITVDTEKDSEQTIRRAIAFLEEELRHRGSAPVKPVQVNSRPAFGEQTSQSTNSFNDMFGSNDSEQLSGSQHTVSSSSEGSPSMFDVFSHEAPSSQPTHQSPSASDLLSEPEVEDVTQDLASQIMQKGSTRDKRDSDFTLEPY